MKDYQFNRQPKDIRFLAAFRKSFNKDRRINGFTIEESANELGISAGTFDQKLKPSAENDITVSEWSHFLDLSADFSTLEYFARKHGFTLQKLDVVKKECDELAVGNQADKTMIEFNEAWAKTKHALEDNKLTKLEKHESLRELEEALKEMQQLHSDITACEIKD